MWESNTVVEAQMPSWLSFQKSEKGTQVRVQTEELLEYEAKMSTKDLWSLVKQRIQEFNLNTQFMWASATHHKGKDLYWDQNLKEKF